MPAITNLDDDWPEQRGLGLGGMLGTPTTGDVSGSLPGDLTIVGIQGVPVCVTVPSLNDVLTFDGTDWCPAPPASTGVDVTDGSTTVTGALTLTAPPGGVTSITATNAGLEFLTNVNGGQGKVKAHGNFGATETIDLADGGWHWGTLTASCTFTFTVIAGTKDCEFWLEMIEDGTGGWSPTFPGSVTFPGGTPTHDTTAGSSSVYGFISRDGGTTWIGGILGAGPSYAVPSITYGTPAAGAATTGIRSDATIAKPTEADLSLSNVTTGNVTTARHGFAPILPNDATKYLDGTGAYTVPPTGATASDTGIWRPLLDSSTGAIIVNGTTGEATMGFGTA